MGMETEQRHVTGKGVRRRWRQRVLLLVMMMGMSAALAGCGIFNWPDAFFTAAPTTGPAPLTVQFTDESTGDVSSCSWNFGDGGTSSETSPTHTFTEPGIYTVSLIVAGGFLNLGASTWTEPQLIVVTTGAEEEPPAEEDEFVQEVLEVDGVPAVRLYNGNVYLLEPPEMIAEYAERFPRSDAGLAPTSLVRTMSGGSVPNSVDLRSYQTPHRDQAPRGLCATFAVCAALEARLKRETGQDYDLSEEFVHRIQKMAILTEDLQPESKCLENSSGGWGGGWDRYILGLLGEGGYAVPPESTLAYISTKEMPFGWAPSARCVTGSSQREASDWDLDPSRLPLSALAEAAISIPKNGGMISCDVSSLANPIFEIESALAYGREVIISFDCYFGDPSDNGIWNPGPEEITDSETGETKSNLAGGHAMLLVGYDREKRFFYVKNSWGLDQSTNGDQGFTRFGYDWFERGYVGGASVVTGVVSRSDQYTSPYDQQQSHLLLGAWNLNHAGWEGLLHIYRLGELLPTSGLHGQHDYRLGTYYGNDGVARRVNGTIDEHEITFWIDWGDPNQDYGETRSTNPDVLWFDGRLLTGSKTLLAGEMTDGRDGRHYGFYGTKDEYLGSLGVPGGTTESWLGRWEVWTDQEVGFLEFASVYQDPLENITRLDGTFTPTGGFERPVRGYLREKLHIHIYVPLGDDLADEVVLDGRMLGGDPGVVAGLYDDEAMPYPANPDPYDTFGFVMRRIGDAAGEPALSVHATADPTQVPAGGNTVIEVLVTSSGIPVAGANVEILAGGGSYEDPETHARTGSSIAGTTGASGEYTARWFTLDPSVYTGSLNYVMSVRATKPGYQAASSELTVTVKPYLE